MRPVVVACRSKQKEERDKLRAQLESMHKEQQNKVWSLQRGVDTAEQKLAFVISESTQEASKLRCF